MTHYNSLPPVSRKYEIGTRCAPLPKHLQIIPVREIIAKKQSLRDCRGIPYSCCTVLACGHVIFQSYESPGTGRTTHLRCFPCTDGEPAHVDPNAYIENVNTN